MAPERSDISGLFRHTNSTKSEGGYFDTTKGFVILTKGFLVPENSVRSGLCNPTKSDNLTDVVIC